MSYGSAVKWIAGVGLCMVAMAGCASTEGTAQAENTVLNTAENTGQTSGQSAGDDAGDDSGDSSASQTVQDSATDQNTDQPTEPSTDTELPNPDTSAQLPTGQSSAQVPTDEPSEQPSADDSAAPQPPTQQSNAPKGACRATDVDLELGRIDGAAGSVYVPLIFTNTSSKPCTLQGFPGISYVTNDDGTQLGDAAAWEGEEGPTVKLQPGDQASTVVREVNVGMLDPADCDPTPADGLRVYLPGENHSLYIEQDGARGCSVHPLPDGQLLLSVETIAEGLPQ